MAGKPNFARVTNEQIIQALENSGGMVTHAAKMLGVKYDTVYRRIKGDQELQAKLREIQESRLDLAETKLMEAVKAGKAWAVCFFLKCVGKRRGYVERQQVEHTGLDGEPISMNVKFNFVKAHGEKAKEKPLPTSGD